MPRKGHIYSTTMGSSLGAENESISGICGYSENYYHGFLCGLLKTSSRYRVYSNRENGYGHPDIVLKTPGLKNGSAVIMELKVADSFGKMETENRTIRQQEES